MFRYISILIIRIEAFFCFQEHWSLFPEHQIGQCPQAQQLLPNCPKELSAAHCEHRSVSLQSGPSISIDGLTLSQAVKAQFTEMYRMRLKIHKLRYGAYFTVVAIKYVQIWQSSFVSVLKNVF